MEYTLKVSVGTQQQYNTVVSVLNSLDVSYYIENACFFVEAADLMMLDKIVTALKNVS